MPGCVLLPCRMAVVVQRRDQPGKPMLLDERGGVVVVVV